jgi:transcriptional regulator with AAA-type ATPase domain
MSPLTEFFCSAATLQAGFQLAPKRSRRSSAAVAGNVRELQNLMERLVASTTG